MPRPERPNLVTISDMSPAPLIVIVLCVLAIFVIWLVWRGVHPNRAEAWPLTQGTIQSVGSVIVHSGRSSFSIDVGNFSYDVNGEYYSGRLTIAASSFIGERSPRGLVNQKIQIRYNPDNPEKFLVPQAEVGGFVLGPYTQPFGEDVDPIDLNIDKF